MIAAALKCTPKPVLLILFIYICLKRTFEYVGHCLCEAQLDASLFEGLGKLLQLLQVTWLFLL